MRRKRAVPIPLRRDIWPSYDAVMRLVYLDHARITPLFAAMPGEDRAAELERRRNPAVFVPPEPATRIRMRSCRAKDVRPRRPRRAPGNVIDLGCGTGGNSPPAPPMSRMASDFGRGGRRRPDVCPRADRAQSAGALGLESFADGSSARTCFLPGA